ncbi:MAG: GAF domain-containing protein [Chloroflexi bacterium]|nr:GAF domain-containing protein [Chloroflexota bacterium]
MNAKTRPMPKTAVKLKKKDDPYRNHIVCIIVIVAYFGGNMQVTNLDFFMLINYLIYLAIPIIALELILMTYGYLQNPKDTSSRLFAALMLVLAFNSAAVLTMGTAPDSSVAMAAAWLHLLGLFIAGALIWLFTVQLFGQPLRYRRHLMWIAVLLLAISVSLLVLDLFIEHNLIFDFNAVDFSGSYVSTAHYLTDIGVILYRINITLPHLAVPLFLLLLIVSRRLELRLRSAARNILILLTLMFVVNLICLFVLPELLGLVGSFSIALIVAWVMAHHGVLSPVPLGMQQALDTAVVGVLVFNPQWKLLNSNQTARCLLQFESRASLPLTLTTILEPLADRADKKRIGTFLRETATAFASERTLGITLSQTETSQIVWLHLNFQPIINETDSRLAGYLGMVEDQTAARQIQEEIAVANRSLEKYASQARLLSDIARSGVTDLGIPAMAQRFADRLGEMFAADGCFITGWDDIRQRPYPIAAYGPLQEIYGQIHQPEGIPSVTETVLKSGVPLVISNIPKSPYQHFHDGRHLSIQSMLALPIQTDDQKMGAAIILYDTSQSFSPEEVNLGEQAARQIALALAKVNLLHAEREQRELAETFRKIALALTSTLDYEAVLDLLLDHIAHVVPYDSAAVSVLDNGRIQLVRLHGFENFVDLPDERLPDLGFDIEHTPTYRTMYKTGNPLHIPDVTISDDWVVTPISRHIKSFIGIPLCVEGEVIAFLSVDKIEPGYYQLYHVERLLTFAYQAALTLQRADLYAEAQRWANQLTTLNNIAAEMVGLVTEQALTDMVVQWLHHEFKYANVMICMVDQNQNDLALRSVVGLYEWLVDNFEHRQKLGEGVMGQVVEMGKPVLVNDTRQNPHFFQYPDMSVLSELAIPIKADNQIFGALNVDSNSLNAFGDRDIVTLTIVADQLAVAIQKARLFELTTKRAGDLEALSTISAELRTAQTIADILPIILQNCVTAINATIGTIFLAEGEGQAVCRAIYPPGAYPIGLRQPANKGVTGIVMQTGEPYISTDYQHDETVFWQESEREVMRDVRGSIALPLCTEKTVIGVINIGLPQANLSQDEIHYLKSIADISANALYRAQIMESLEMRVSQRTQELQQAYLQLQELDQLKSKFISDVTHELRTPVTNLRLYMDLIRRGKPEKRPHYMNVIEQQTVRLTEIVENTLRLPRLEDVAEWSDFSPVALDEIVRTAVDDFIPRAEAANLNLTFSTTPNIPKIWGDAAKLDEAIKHLLANAVNYSEDGEIQVDLFAEQEGEKVCLCVSDTGIGIPSEELPRLFDPFYRGQQVGQLNIPGMGLGLTLVQKVMDLHNGRIEISSNPGQGTRCCLYFPAVQL